MNKCSLLIAIVLIASSCATYKPLEEPVTVRDSHTNQLIEVTPAPNVVVIHKRKNERALIGMHPDLVANISPARKLIVRSPHHITISMPSMNFINMTPLNSPDREKALGFYGVGMGYMYDYTPHSFISFQADIGTAWNNKDLECIDEHVDNANFSLSNNNRFGRFTLGYGLNISWYNWRETLDWWYDDYYYGYYDGYRNNRCRDYENDLRYSGHWATGLVLSSHIKLAETFEMGVVYRPAFMRLVSSEKWKYQHSIFIDMRLNLNPGRRVYKVF